MFICGVAVNNFYLAHYGAPATALVYALLVQCMRVVFLLRLGAQPLGIRTENDPWTWYGTTARPGDARAEILRRLENMPGRQLVIVEYSANHEAAADWVYNDPDIDGAKVVWARDMGAENGKLLAYFAGREVWIAEPDFTPPRLTLYRR